MKKSLVCYCPSLPYDIPCIFVSLYFVLSFSCVCYPLYLSASLFCYFPFISFILRSFLCTSTAAWHVLQQPRVSVSRTMTVITVTGTVATLWSRSGKFNCLYYDPRWQDLLSSVWQITVHNVLQAAALSYRENILRPSASSVSYLYRRVRKTGKTTITFVMSVCLSVRPSAHPRGTNRLPL